MSGQPKCLYVSCTIYNVSDIIQSLRDGRWSVCIFYLLLWLSLSFCFWCDICRYHPWYGLSRYFIVDWGKFLKRWTINAVIKNKQLFLNIQMQYLRLNVTLLTLKIWTNWLHLNCFSEEFTALIFSELYNNCNNQHLYYNKLTMSYTNRSLQYDTATLQCVVWTNTC